MPLYLPARRTLIATSLLIALCGVLLTGCSSNPDQSTPIKVGILHSMTGTMSFSEKRVANAELLAVRQINRNGGVLGRRLETIVEDGSSDWVTFNRKARKLLQGDDVSVVFGGWTSASRKAVKPVFERLNGLLWYPVQYEGFESSSNIFYTGAAPNQQIVPAVNYVLNQEIDEIYLVGSDYLFPRMAHRIIREQLKDEPVEVVGEAYRKLGSTNFQPVIDDIERKDPDLVINTLNGRSNFAFFEQYHASSLTPETVPVMSTSIGEPEVKKIGPSVMAGHLLVWNYYQSIETPENESFVQAYKREYGSNAVVNDPMESAYTAVYLWKKAVEKAGSTKVDKVREAAAEISMKAPQGTVKIDRTNHHLWQRPRIGRIRDDGQVRILRAADELVRPDPYLKSYGWAKNITLENVQGE